MAEPKRTYVAVQPVKVVNADSITLTIGNIGIKGSSDGGTTFEFVHTDTSGDLQVDILSSALPSGAATLAEQQSQTTLLGTIDADTSHLSDAYNAGNTSLDTTETSPVALQRADLATYIDGVTTTTSGSWVTFTS